MATWRFRLASGVPLGTSVAVGGAMGAIPAAILQKEMNLSNIRVPPVSKLGTQGEGLGGCNLPPTKPPTRGNLFLTKPPPASWSSGRAHSLHAHCSEFESDSDPLQSRRF